jgi:hypothetical protein
MLLDSNKQQHKEITKNRKTQQDRQNTQKRRAEKNTDQVGLQEAPHLQDLYRIIWNTPNTAIPKRNFSLLSNPLVLFNRIFRG